MRRSPVNDECRRPHEADLHFRKVGFPDAYGKLASKTRGGDMLKSIEKIKGLGLSKLQ